MLMIALTNPDGEKQFVTSWTDSWIFSYLIGLGDWDTGNFDGNASTAVWIFFLLNTVFSTVVMLNLLIAIISDTYARVKENAESAAYQEKARMISENAYLIPEARKDAQCPPNSYLVFSQSASPSESGVDATLEELNNQKSKVKEFEVKVTELLDGIEKFKEEFKH